MFCKYINYNSYKQINYIQSLIHYNIKVLIIAYNIKVIISTQWSSTQIDSYGIDMNNK